MDKVTVQSAPADGTVLLPRGSTDARAQSDTRSGLEEWTGGPEEPITGQDPCIVRPPSHLKMQGVLNLDPSCLVFSFSFFFFWKSELRFPRLALRTRLFTFDSILFGSDDGKLNRVSKIGQYIRK
jgi:hypothetical protein